jgi:hypothetical protein
MGITKPCIIIAVVASVASLGLLLATMYIPNWVKAIWRVPGQDDCVVGNLGAFEANFMPESECAQTSPLASFKDFTSDTLEFWPLFPMQAPGNGNPFPVPADFESCPAALNTFDAGVAALVGNAKGAAETPSSLLYGVAVGGADLVDEIVMGLQEQLAPAFSAVNAYLGVLQAGGNPEKYFNGTDNLSAQFNYIASLSNTTTVELVEFGFKTIAFACQCVDEVAGCSGAITASAVDGITAGLAEAGVSSGDCSTPFGQANVGKAYAIYSVLSGKTVAEVIAPSNQAAMKLFVEDSFEFFEAIVAGEVTNAKRFAAMHTTRAQRFIATDLVQAFLEAAAAPKGIDAGILAKMLGLVKIAGCHGSTETTCTGLNILASVFLYAHELILAPSPVVAGDPSASDILNMVGPAITFFSQGNVAVQAGIIATEYPLLAAGNSTHKPVALATARATLKAASSLFTSFNTVSMLSNPMEYGFLTSADYDALLVSKGAASGAIDGVIPLLELCACSNVTTAAGGSGCASDYASVGPTLRAAFTGSSAPITNGTICFAFVETFKTQETYKRAWSGVALSATARADALQECEDDETDLEHITLGRTMLIVALPILIIGILSGFVAASKFNSGADGFSKFAAIAGIAAIIAGGLTMFGLLHVQAAPVYAAVGVDCEGPAVCYENDFAAKIALVAALAPVISGVAFLVCAFVGAQAGNGSDSVSSGRDSQLAANPKFSI